MFQNIKMAEIKGVVVKIIENLISATENEEITWTQTNSVINSETSKEYENKSLDGNTKFRATVRMKDDYTFHYGEIAIYNSNLINGVNYISHYDNKDICDRLGKIIFKNYITPNIQRKNEDQAYKNILESIGGKQSLRDRKINSILGEGFFNKLFK